MESPKTAAVHIRVASVRVVQASVLKTFSTPSVWVSLMNTAKAISLKPRGRWVNNFAFGGTLHFVQFSSPTLTLATWTGWVFSAVKR